MNATMSEVAESLCQSLVEYIEATYHIADAKILRQRNALLNQIGVIHQAPYLESTPRYLTGSGFSTIPGLNPAVRELLCELAKPTVEGRRLLFDPPYTHQSKALLHNLVEDKNLVIMTGTGSGKTETFLMPILGKLAIEASRAPQTFQEQPGMRALILYPMNALVNDQLGRLRAILGDPRLVNMFMAWANRPPRFARYTSRTPYAGVRKNNEKDRARLKPFGEFYVRLLKEAKNNDEAGQLARQQIEALKARGKWPAKPDLERWYLGPTARGLWQETESDGTKRFIRAVTLPTDSELLTRHEAQDFAPDLMVTNYSMLEYMLMRPVERPIFDQTKEWLARCPDEKFLLVLDEAHLYRGATGTEVALLIRRLRDRLDIPSDRFRVICASASFESKEKALAFAADLTGNETASFEPIEGDQAKQSNPEAASDQEAQLFAALPLDTEFRSTDPRTRRDAIAPLLTLPGVTQVTGESVEATLYRALKNYKPLALLINETMGKAVAVSDLGAKIFPTADKLVADLAATNLAALASTAREHEDAASLLPCRVHSFFRGLRGLWACMDPNCSAVEPAERSGIIGKLFSQPRNRCECNACVFEFYTCRACGTAYARGYSDNPEAPKTVWPEAGTTISNDGSDSTVLAPIEMLLVDPGQAEGAIAHTLDLLNSRLNDDKPQSRERLVYLPVEREPRLIKCDDDADSDSDSADDEYQGQYAVNMGMFGSCVFCARKAHEERSPIQDHETKGDQPFQVLVTQQLQVQPPNNVRATKFAPLRGRKVLAFSDSRQVAARLAPNLQMFSVRDSLRPLMVRGWMHLYKIPNFALRVQDLYTAVLIAACEVNVRLDPEMTGGETFPEYQLVSKRVEDGVLNSFESLKELCLELRSERLPQRLQADIMATLRDRAFGLEALAVATIVEHEKIKKVIVNLPDVPGVTESVEDRLALARAWLREWSRDGFLLPSMTDDWYLRHPDKKVRITPRKPAFKKFFSRLPNAQAKKIFKDVWLKKLLDNFTEKMSDKEYRLIGNNLSLMYGGSWVRCTTCKSVHRPVRLLPVCLDCGRATVASLDPETDEAFIKRKGFYRRGILDVVGENPIAPLSLIAAEHTAQLNAAEQDQLFSKAEENELRFQDVELEYLASGRTNAAAVDVLSSTTTMEVGIDLGQLPAVALRNMPPTRANYQQRAGRAGRRGNTIATVIAFGGSDTHDEHFFSRPADMISGPVVDPILCLDNTEIAKRHIRAFLIQSYHQDRITSTSAEDRGDLFSVLGKVSDFHVSSNPINRVDFGHWMEENRDALRHRVANWIPTKLDPTDRQQLLDSMIQETLEAVDLALKMDSDVASDAELDQDDIAQYLEVPLEQDDAQSFVRMQNQNLLDRLLYKGVLPRYAFPTNVATFHVFDSASSNSFKPRLKFAPTQGLVAALSQYAPERQIWIAGKCYTSGALYSSDPKGLSKQWDSKKVHLECSRCSFAFTRELYEGFNRGDQIDCNACLGPRTVGPAKYWIQPTGFAHPFDWTPLTSTDELPEISYATRAKLTMQTPDDENWLQTTNQIRYLTTRRQLLVSNSGPDDEGYRLCTACGRIEATKSWPTKLAGEHTKPYPSRKPMCTGFITDRVVLGTEFLTDIALFSFKLQHPLKLRPADTVTASALRTLCEALARAASDLLAIEPGEVLAEFRPALTELGVQGLETEIFLYDVISGGAGFSAHAALKGRELFEAALKLMMSCKEDCDASCYRCLRTFRNRLDHGQLDRFMGIALVQYLLDGEIPRFESKRIIKATNLLLEDLKRYEQFNPQILDCSIEDDQGNQHETGFVVTSRADKPVVVVVTNPLLVLDHEPRSVNLDGVDMQVLKVHEFVVRNNLSTATLSIVQALGY